MKFKLFLSVLVFVFLHLSAVQGLLIIAFCRNEGL